MLYQLSYRPIIDLVFQLLPTYSQDFLPNIQLQYLVIVTLEHLHFFANSVIEFTKSLFAIIFSINFKSMWARRESNSHSRKTNVLQTFDLASLPSDPFVADRRIELLNP